MLKKVISGIVFIILLTTTFTLRLDTQLIEAEPRTWTVNYDGSVEFKKTSDTITMADVADDSRASIRHGLRPTSRAFFENGLDTRLTDISQLSFEASSKWVRARVDMKDIAIAAMAFGSYPGHPRWNLIVDINQDNHVDMRDIALIARNFGKTC